MSNTTKKVVFVTAEAEVGDSYIGVTSNDIMVKEYMKTKLEYELGDIDLGPRSNFWNYGLSTSTDDFTHVQSVKLMDGDNYFDLAVPFQEIAFSWLRVHPTIASSHQAWERGEYPAETQFYVVDDEIENAVIYKKKQLINKAM